MSLLSRLQALIGFTRTEALVLLFLAGTFLLGLGVRYVLGRGDPPAASPPAYRGSDSTFSARSLLANDLSPASTPRPATRPRKSLPPSGSIALNSSSKNDLMRLPGIGAAYADRIIAYRREHGPFRSLDEIQAVKGIGPKTYERIKPFLRLH